MQTNDNGENDGPPGTGVRSQISSQDVRSTTDFLRDQMHREDHSCTTTQAFNNTTGSPPTKAQWHNVSLNNEGQSQSSSDGTGSPDTYENMITRVLEIEKTLTTIKEKVTNASGSPDTYENMITRVLEIEKTLTTIKEKVTNASVRCHLLNVDVVTMFSPEMVDTLNETVEQCEKCIKTMETLPLEDS